MRIFRRTTRKHCNYSLDGQFTSYQDHFVTSKPYLDNLPTELQFIILSYLDGKAKKTIELLFNILVCDQSNNSLPKRFLISLTLHTLK